MLDERADRHRRRDARPQRPAWPTLRRAIAMHRPHGRLVLALLAVIVFASVVGLAPSYIILKIIDDALIGDDPGQLNSLVFLMLIAVGLTSFSGVAQSYLSQSIGQSVMFDLRRKLYRHLTGMSMRWFTSMRPG